MWGAGRARGAAPVPLPCSRVPSRSYGLAEVRREHPPHALACFSARCRHADGFAPPRSRQSAHEGRYGYGETAAISEVGDDGLAAQTSNLASPLPSAGGAMNWSSRPESPNQMDESGVRLVFPPRLEADLHFGCPGVGTEPIGIRTGSETGAPTGSKPDRDGGIRPADGL